MRGTSVEEVEILRWIHLLQMWLFAIGEKGQHLEVYISNMNRNSSSVVITKFANYFCALFPLCRVKFSNRNYGYA